MATVNYSSGKRIYPKLLLLTLLILKLSWAWVDEDASSFESIDCNKIYPFGFTYDSDTSIEILDFEVSSF